jgi:Flp pilus assembly protein TadG
VIELFGRSGVGARNGARRHQIDGRGRPRTRDLRRGQSLVEFALILTPLFLILLGIIQFGFIFNTYVTLTNAAREAARSGSIYVYDESLDTNPVTAKALNDLSRNEAIKSELTTSMNLLSKNSPQFTVGSTWTQSGLTFTNGDLTVTYVVPSGVTDSDPRTGEQITVQAKYHQDLIIPLIANLLPKDAGGRLVLTGEVTMVIN